MAIVHIDPAFQAQIPPLRPEERETLEASLQAEGCRDPLVVWRETNILLDGHNRYEICTRLGIPFTTIGLDFPDRELAADWIDANQLGRRNLTPDQYSLLRGRRYNRLRKQGVRRDLSLNFGREAAEADGTSPQIEEKLKQTSSAMAERYGVSRSTIERDGQFARAVESLKPVEPAIEARVAQGQAPARGVIIEAAKRVKAAEKAVAETVHAAAANPIIRDLTRQEKAAVEILEQSKEDAAKILSGTKTLRDIKLERQRAEREEMRRAELEARAAAARAAGAGAAPRCVLHTGDCLEILAGMPARSARLAFADPPYNIGVDYGAHYDDARNADEFQRWCVEWMAGVHRVLTDDGSLWLLISHEWAWVLCYEAVETIGFHLQQWITWYESFGVNMTGKFNRCSRALLWLVKDRERFVFRDCPEIRRASDRQAKYGDIRANPDGKLWDDVWGVNPPIPRLTGTAAERIPGFPTQLPLALVRPVVACASDVDDLVLDPFNGSGTTGVAALGLGRRYVGIELSGRFADTARLRLESANGGPLHDPSRE